MFFLYGVAVHVSVVFTNSEVYVPLIDLVHFLLICGWFLTNFHHNLFGDVFLLNILCFSCTLVAFCV